MILSIPHNLKIIKNIIHINDPWENSLKDIILDIFFVLGSK